MKFKLPSTGLIKAELQMTSMIDIVFLLLIFFILTFKIAPKKGISISSCPSRVRVSRMIRYNSPSSYV